MNQQSKPCQSYRNASRCRCTSSFLCRRIPLARMWHRIPLDSLGSDGWRSRATFRPSSWNLLGNEKWLRGRARLLDLSRTLRVALTDERLFDSRERRCEVADFFRQDIAHCTVETARSWWAHHATMATRHRRYSRAHRDSKASPFYPCESCCLTFRRRSFAMRQSQKIVAPRHERSAARLHLHRRLEESESII